ncbi:hypothetical protein [Nocardiopsis lucentensis]|uniref:hypothetical protein n=1 Tax=Nocardiopsis lucentensis TaxID=53441 RepID=UPI00034D7EC5|nr:hypothetical protein [Nocardiopsis lucentensis]
MSYAQPPFGQPTPPQPPGQGMSTGKKVGLGCGGCLGVLLVLMMFAGCVSVLSGGDTSVESDPAPAAGSAADETADAEEAAGEDEGTGETGPAESGPAPEPEPEEASTVGNGVHRVGEDIEPGTYTTEGPDPDDIVPMCYWARLSGLSGEFDDIIANGNLEGPGVVVVEEGDAALELSGDCEWTLE